MEDSNAIEKTILVKKVYWNNRLDKFKLWLDKSNGNTIALVSHGTFLSQITDYMLENCEHFIWEY